MQSSNGSPARSLRWTTTSTTCWSPTKTLHGQKRNSASTGCGQSNLSRWCTHEYWAYRYRPTLDNQASRSTLWRRRDCTDLNVLEQLTKRSVFWWCGRLTGHYPVCGWQRPACSYLKRVASQETEWDRPVPDKLRAVCEEMHRRLVPRDPVGGVWFPGGGVQTGRLWCDASDIAYGAVLEINNRIIEMQRGYDRKTTSGTSMLQNWMLSSRAWPSLRSGMFTIWRYARIPALSLVGCKQSSIGNTHQIKTGGLYDVLVQRQIQVVNDLVTTAGLDLSLKWVPSHENKVDQLSRVQSWCKSVKLPDEVCATSVGLKVCGPVSRAQIQIGQQTDDQIQEVIADLREDCDVSDEVFSRYQSQLVVHGGLLCHSYLHSVDGTIIVPVLQQAFQEDVVLCSHINTA